MARQRQTKRPGHLWQPVGVKEKEAPRRDAGRRRRTGVAKRWRMPSLRLAMPELHMTARWRKIALVVGAASIVALGTVSLYQSALLSVGDVSVEGNATVSTELIAMTADLEGESMIQPDFASAEQRLEALPIVKSATITRDWPNSAHIAVIERKPWAVWQAGAQHAVIDNEGVVLDAAAPEGALVIVQKGGNPALTAGASVDIGAVDVARRLVPTAERTLGRPVVALEFSKARGLTAVLGGADRPRLRATFGDANDYEFKVAALYAVLRQADEAGQQLQAVDLRFGGRVAVRAAGN